MHYAIINNLKFKNDLRLKELFNKGAVMIIKDKEGYTPMDLVNMQDEYNRDRLLSLFVIDYWN